MKQLWQDVTPEMMTEEETGTENNYIRHRQSWRSRRFNTFIDKLDESKNPKTLAKQRDCGENIVREAPHNTKKWMIDDGESDESTEY